jgi:hypothetical protein
MDILQYVGSIGGIAGVLSFIIFCMYRQDRKSAADQLREDRKFMEDRLTKLLEADQISREANTKALTELTTLISRLNDKH